MKILHIIRSVNPEGGGPIEGIIQLSKNCENLGHTIEILSLDLPTDSFVNDCPILVNALGPGLGKYGYSKNFIPWLKSNAKNYNAFIINGIWQYHSYAGHKVLHNLKLPYFLYTHGMLDPWFKQAYPLKHLKKMLYWPWGEYPVLRDAKKVLFTCEEEKLLARQSFLPFYCNEHVVNFGSAGHEGNKEYQTQLFFNSFPILKNKRYILFLSRIHPKKGVDILIQAFASISKKYPDIYLVIAGPDQVGIQNDLQNIAIKHEISDKIFWLGMLKGDIKWGAYLSAEVFVLPSHQENFGLVVVEALSCSLPVLISNKVNIWHEINNDKAGIIANDNVLGCEELLENWLRLTKESKSEFRTNAYTCFNKRFNIKNAAQSLLEALES